MKKAIWILTHALLFSSAAFTTTTYATAPPSPCYIMYDAGSSGTRLYIYEQQGAAWLEHEGPKVSALADPVREIRGKTQEDIDAVTTEVVAALDAIKQDGPNKDGKPKWAGFDWTAQCQVAAAKVYATAGMRIAEQENSAASLELWNTLQQKLQAKVGESVRVSTRTITGYEEGLYAWLAIRAQHPDSYYGIVEMGGASSQVTFPCSKCAADDDASLTINIDGNPVQIYSYSFLGLGQDEASKSLGGLPPACAYGIGIEQPDWKPENCGSQISVTQPMHAIPPEAIVDPYNYGEVLSTYDAVPTQQADAKQWFLTGAFNYLQASDIDTCCYNKGDCYNAENSCYKTIYLPIYLQSLNVPVTSERKTTSWTEGAVFCDATNCLPETETPVCRWLDKACLN